MAAGVRVRTRRWVAALIITLFFIAVAGAAAVGWWWARESPPHQGPIVLVSIDGVPAADLSAYGAQRSDTPAIDAMANESVVFDRAYTHSPQTLPAHASLLTGRLPIDHGVRDDAGFSLPPDTGTLAALLRNRGFATGAAVSSFLLQQRTGLGQGFSFFDDDLPAGTPDQLPATERGGSQTIDVAERWMASQNGQRFFLFVQVPGRDADTAVMRLSAALKERGLYDDATMVLVGDRGDVGSGLTLDDRALRVPFIVKQPDGQGGGRRVPFPVQNVDLLPTILDLVRAPVPGGLAGRSLRPVLDDGDTTMPASPIYSESLAAYFRFGGEPVYALTGNHFRFARGIGEDLVPLETGEDSAGEAAEAARLRTELDGLLATSTIAAPAPIEPREEDRYALLGYLSAGGPAAAVDVAAGRGPAADARRGASRRCRAHRAEEVHRRNTSPPGNRAGSSPHSSRFISSWGCCSPGRAAPKRRFSSSARFASFGPMRHPRRGHWLTRSCGLVRPMPRASRRRSP